MATLKLEVDKDFVLKPHMQRILLKAIKNRDDLDQLYAVIRASIADGNDITVEVWENVNQAEVVADEGKRPIAGETSWNN